MDNTAPHPVQGARRGLQARAPALSVLPLMASPPCPHLSRTKAPPLPPTGHLASETHLAPEQTPSPGPGWGVGLQVLCDPCPSGCRRHLCACAWVQLQLAENVPEMQFRWQPLGLGAWGPPPGRPFCAWCFHTGSATGG